jgi:1,2-diacylglycerol 3-alpha-glucosyltransferase
VDCSVSEGRAELTLRIAMWTDSYYPYISGVTRAVSTSKATLSSMGHQVRVFCPGYPGQEQEDDVFRFKSFRAPTNSTYYIGIPMSIRIRSELERFSPDVMHIHSPFNVGRLGLTVGRRMKVPVVFTYHTMYNMYAHYVPLIGKAASEIVEKMAFRVADSVDVVITPSSALADYLRSNGVKTPILPIPNGVPIEEFQNGDPTFLQRVYKVPSDVKVVLTSGRLGLEKNLSTLLNAFSLIARSSDSVLVMVGDGPERHNLQRLADSLEISERVFMVGTVEPERMADVYAGADIFMFTSLTDTQGLVLVEAKAAGVPAVAVGALGVKDMVIDGEDGYLCNNRPEELAEKVLYLLNNPDKLSSISQNAKHNAREFSREVYAKRLLECYHSASNK